MATAPAGSPTRAARAPRPRAVRAAPAPVPAPLDEQRIGVEARAGADDHITLRLWLRLLACSTQIETEIRQRLRARFGTTLSRFDYLAQLHRHPEGLRMNALSRYLMVTGGNTTGLTDQLEAEGLVQRRPAPGDRRAVLLRLTPQGRRSFEAMAAEHEAWLLDLFGGLGVADRHSLHQLLGRLRSTSAQRQADRPPAPRPDPTEEAA